MPAPATSPTKASPWPFSHLPSQTADPVIALETVTRRFDEGMVTAVNDVSLALRGGEWLTIMGPSGSGKSTLLHLMGGIDRPNTGTVRVLGRPVQRPAEWRALRARLFGFVFQEAHLLPTLTASENVQLPLFGQGIPARERAKRSRDLLARVGVGHREHHKPGELSGGERARVAIARALANAPRFLLADEPTGSLDSATSTKVLDLFSDIHVQDGLTLVVVTHDPKVAERASRRVAVMDGRVVADDAGEGV